MFVERRTLAPLSSRAGLPLVVAAVLAAGPARGADRVTIGVSGLWAPDGIELTRSRTFTEYAETARLEWSAEQKAGWGGEGTIEGHIGRRLGIELAVAALRRDGTAKATVSIPHPLYLNRPRTASAEAAIRHEERAVHLSILYRARRGRLRAKVAGGGSIFRVSQDLVDDASYGEAYPYDEIAIRELVLNRVSDRAFGFNVGGELGLRVAGPMALAAGVRFSRGRVSLESAKDEAVSIDAGGLQVRFGLRLTL